MNLTIAIIHSSKYKHAPKLIVILRAFRAVCSVRVQFANPLERPH